MPCLSTCADLLTPPPPHRDQSATSPSMSRERISPSETFTSPRVTESFRSVELSRWCAARRSSRRLGTRLTATPLVIPGGNHFVQVQRHQGWHQEVCFETAHLHRPFISFGDGSWVHALGLTSRPFHSPRPWTRCTRSRSCSRESPLVCSFPFWSFW